DGDGRAVRRVQIDCAPGGGHVEGHVVGAGHAGEAVGADLVGHVAVPGDAVGADHDRAHLAAAHEEGGHRVGDDFDGDLVLVELPRGQSSALEVGAGLVGEHAEALAG